MVTNSWLVSSGEEPSRRYKLTETELLIGRDQSSDICLPEIKISRRHCRISYLSNRYYLDNLGSSNGTYVNDARVTRCKLNPGDRIRIGDTELVFQAGSESDEGSDAAAADRSKSLSQTENESCDPHPLDSQQSISNITKSDTAAISESTRPNHLTDSVKSR